MQNCHICTKFKSLKQKIQSWLHFFSVLKYYWCDVFMNYVNSLLSSTFINIIYQYVLIFIDHLTKMKHLILIISIKIKKTIECFYVHIWKYHDLSEFFMFDKDTQFISDIWQHLYQMLKINVKLFTTYHLKTDKQIKKINIIIKYYFWVFVNYIQNDWAKWLSDAEFSVNNTFFSITLASSFLTNFRQNSYLEFKFSEPLSVKLIIQTRIKLLNIKEFIKKMKKLTEHL